MNSRVIKTNVERVSEKRMREDVRRGWDIIRVTIEGSM
jgi:hypothetical protein